MDSPAEIGGGGGAVGGAIAQTPVLASEFYRIIGAQEDWTAEPDLRGGGGGLGERQGGGSSKQGSACHVSSIAAGNDILNCKMPRRLALLVFAVAAGSLLAQKVWREYPAFEYNDFPIPRDYQEKTEFTFARLMYPNAAFGFGGRGFGRRSTGCSWARTKRATATTGPRSPRGRTGGSAAW